MWEQLKTNELCCFRFRDESPAFLRTAEVTSIDDNQRAGEFWYWIDKQPGPYKPTQPIEERRLTAEWADHRGRTQIKPTAAQRAEWAPRSQKLSLEDIEIILPVLKVRTSGEVKPEHADKINAWLRTRARHDQRAEKALRTVRLEREIAKRDILRDCCEEIRRLSAVLQQGKADEPPTTPQLDTLSQQIHRVLRVARCVTIATTEPEACAQCVSMKEISSHRGQTKQHEPRVRHTRYHKCKPPRPSGNPSSGGFVAQGKNCELP